MNPPDALFAALADPTRRGVIEALAEGPATPGALAGRLAVTPQALSRHLRMLRREGLVDVAGEAEDARLRRYRLRRGALAPLRGWLDQAEALWETQLAAFRDYAERERR